MERGDAKVKAAPSLIVETGDASAPRMGSVLLRVRDICFGAPLTYEAHIISAEICSVFNVVPLMWFQCIAHATCTMMLWSGLFQAKYLYAL